MNIILKIIICLCLVATAFAQFPRGQDIAEAEYFINIDPGEGNGIYIPANYGYWEVPLEVDNIYLPVGSTIYVRAKSSNGKWSAPRGITRKDFFTNRGNTLQHGEYFINTDPGEGNGIPITANYGFWEVTVQVNDIPLPVGSTIYFRAKSSNGTWSAPRGITRKDFFTNPGATLVYGEYYINTDPGRGNGTPINFSSGTADFTPLNLRRGDKIFTRVKDSFNRWSQSREVTFNYIDMHKAEYRIKRSGGYLNPENMILSALNDTSFFFYAYAYDFPLQPNDSIEVRYQRADGFYSKWGNEFSIVSQTTFQLTVNIANGWNMVSVPGLHPIDQNVNTWWQYRDPGANVFKYLGGYQSVTTTTPGIGYWMKHSGDRTYNTGEEWPAGGIQIVPHDPIAAALGWNLIGGYENSAPTSGLTTTPPGLIDGPVYKYSGGYQIATALDPGYGYWIKLSGAGLINMPGALSKGTTKMAEYIKEDWGRIVITDNTGISYTLYAVKGEVNLDSYELPPMPPAGMFDIRFGSGRIAEDLSSSVQSILMSGIEHPVKVKVENMNIALQDESGKVINTEIKPGEEITIDNSSINKLLVISGEIIAPVEYALEQNYPNPFNPSTTIEYAIPYSGNVSIKVFDILGSEVSVLVDEFQQVGNYSIAFDASNFASGIYFYRIHAGSFVNTKKMMVIK